MSDDKRLETERPRPPLTRRGLFGAIAAAAAVVASVGRRRKEPATPRRRGFWIGHT